MGSGPGQGGVILQDHGPSFETDGRAFADPLTFSERARVEDGEEPRQKICLIDSVTVI